MKKKMISSMFLCGFFLCFFGVSLTYNSIECPREVSAGNGKEQFVSGSSVADWATTDYSRIREEERAAAEGKITLDSYNPFLRLFFWILMAIGKMIALMVNLIKFTMSDTIMRVFETDGLYMGWSVVRDFLNIFFVFFLLFSAFSTVFQVSKYHIRSTWVMIVVMALLVNFSWPVARVIIDVSNVAMYHIVGNSGGSGSDVAVTGLMSSLADDTGFATMMLGEAYVKDNEIQGGNDGIAATMIIGIIIGSVFLFTVGMVAILLLLRVILLAVLLVFASAGFALSAFPTTRGIASRWWDSFLKQAYLGPIVLFTLLLSTKMMSTLSGELGKDAVESGGFLKGAFAALPSYAVAIAMIWAGVLAAQNISGQTASLSLNAARRVRGYGLRGIRGGARIGAQWTGRGVNELSERAANLEGNTGMSRLGRNVGRAYDSLRTTPTRIRNMRESTQQAHERAREASVARGLATTQRFGGDANAVTKLRNRQIAEKKKELKDASTDIDTAMNEFANATGAEQEAIAEFLSEQKEFGKGNAQRYQQIAQMLSRNVNDQNRLSDEIRGALERKLNAEGKANIVLASRMQSGQYADEIAAFEDMFEGMSGGDIAKQEGLMNEMQVNNQYGQIRHLLRQRVQNNARLEQRIRENASGQFINHATGQNGILT